MFEADVFPYVFELLTGLLTTIVAGLLFVTPIPLPLL
jgi:hypothetical protein